MPTYEYECRACGHAFETMHGMTAPVVKKCPKCGKLKLVRLISGGAGVIFKGSGFYETDYKRNRRSADSAQESDKPDGPSKAAGAAKSDAEPAPAAEAKAKNKPGADAKSGAKSKKGPASKKDRP